MDAVPRVNTTANATDATFTYSNPDVVESTRLSPLPEQCKHFTTRLQVPGLTDEEKEQAWAEIQNLWNTHIKPHLKDTSHDVKSKSQTVPQTDLFGQSPQTFLDHLKTCSAKYSTETQLPEDPIAGSDNEHHVLK